MANITVKSLPVKSTESNHLYADLHLDLKQEYTSHDQLWKQPEHKDFKIDFDIDAIRNSIITLLTTSPGEKILNPEYGLDLREFLFDPINRFTQDLIKNKLWNHITTYEPRLHIIEIEVKGSAVSQSYLFNIYFTIPSLRSSVLSLEGSLNTDGYIFR